MSAHLAIIHSVTNKIISNFFSIKPITFCIAYECECETFVCNKYTKSSIYWNLFIPVDGNRQQKNKEENVNKIVPFSPKNNNCLFFVYYFFIPFATNNA